jgi:hypothetical protein
MPSPRVTAGRRRVAIDPCLIPGLQGTAATPTASWSGRRHPAHERLLDVERPRDRSPSRGHDQHARTRCVVEDQIARCPPPHRLIVNHHRRPAPPRDVERRLPCVRRQRQPRFQILVPARSRSVSASLERESPPRRRTGIEKVAMRRSPRCAPRSPQIGGGAPTSAIPPLPNRGPTRGAGVPTARPEIGHDDDAPLRRARRSLAAFNAAR